MRHRYRIAVLPHRDQPAIDPGIRGEVGWLAPQGDNVSERLHANNIAQRNIAGKAETCAERNFPKIAYQAVLIYGFGMPKAVFPETRLKQARKRAGYKTAKAFSDRHGIPQSTYSLHETGKRGLTREAALQYARLLNVSVDYLIGFESSFISAKSEHSTRVAIDRTVEIIGEVQAGRWISALRYAHEDIKVIQAPYDGRYPAARRFGLKVVGPSMNELYPDGSVLICVNFIEIGRGPIHGEKVICQRRGADDTFEATVKQYIETEDGRRWLWPRSAHPEHQVPIELPPGHQDNDNDDVRITALVVSSFKLE